MRSRSQAQHKNAGIGIAETRHRLSPVLPITISTALFTRHLLAISDETRASGASNDFAVEIVQPERHSCSAPRRTWPPFYFGAVEHGMRHARQDGDLRSQ